jgi:subtilisin family serine protease
MSVTVTFDTTENCSSFASAANISIEAGATSVTVPWDKLSSIKRAAGMIDLSSDEQGSSEFIMKGDPTVDSVAALVTVKQDLGDGFFHIETPDWESLFHLVDELDHIHVTGVAFHSVSSLAEVNYSGGSVDPMSADGQWARIRVASTYRPLLTSFNYYDSLVTKSTPEVYIMDSGINWDHQEFANIEHNNFWKMPSFETFDDIIGHGTMVASAVAGQNVGIARNVKLHSVKIIEPGFSPTILDLGNALNAILAEATANPAITRVVNASWAVDENAWLESRFQALLDAGVTIVTSAGNDGVDFSHRTPSNMAGAITVAATDKYDIPAGYNNIAPTDSGLTTNYGLALDMFAPGDNVVVAKASGTDVYGTTSGTSLAAGYVTGVAAQVAALFAGPVPNPILLEKMIDIATTDAILFDDDKFSSNENRLVHIIGAVDEVASSLDLYIGALSETNNKVSIDLNTIIDTSPHVRLMPDEKFVWGISYESPNTETTYSPFIAINDAAAELNVTNPTVPLPEGENIHMVRFKVNATSDTISLDSPWMFFFQVDPSIDPLQTDNDITRALSLTNSTSIFLATTVLK